MNQLTCFWLEMAGNSAQPGLKVSIGKHNWKIPGLH